MGFMMEGKKAQMSVGMKILIWLVVSLALIVVGIAVWKAVRGVLGVG